MHNALVHAAPATVKKALFETQQPTLATRTHPLLRILQTTARLWELQDKEGLIFHKPSA